MMMKRSRGEWRSTMTHWRSEGGEGGREWGEEGGKGDRREEGEKSE